MEKVTQIDRHYTGSFDIVDYHRTHSQLLIRFSAGIPAGDEYINGNLDLRFEMCEYFELPRNFNDMHIVNGSEDDWQYILSRYSKYSYDLAKKNYQVFKITSDGKNYYILAAFFWISTNNLPPDQTSIASPGKYRE